MDFLKKHRPEIEILFQITKTYIDEKFNVELVDFESLNTESRKRHLVYARKIMIVILMEVYNNQKYTQEEIAEVVGLDRTSLIYHCKTHLNDYSILKDYKEEYDAMKEEFLQEIKEVL
jgi:predicted XRE-type DNA-binding protein